MIKKDYITSKFLLKKTNKIKKTQKKTIIKSIFINFIIILLTLNLLYNTQYKEKISKSKKNIETIKTLKKIPPKPKIEWRYIKELVYYNNNYFVI